MITPPLLLFLVLLVGMTSGKEQPAHNLMPQSPYPTLSCDVIDKEFLATDALGKFALDDRQSLGGNVPPPRLPLNLLFSRPPPLTKFRENGRRAAAKQPRSVLPVIL
jgi:hypothetical protein